MANQGRVIKAECLGSGRVCVSAHEMYVLGFVRCSSCGRAFKIRPKLSGDLEVSIPRHSRATKGRSVKNGN